MFADVTIGIQVFLAPLLFEVSVTDVTIGIFNSLLVPLIFVNTVTNITIDLLISNRRYN